MLVATSAADVRYQDIKFASAPAIFANNAVRFDANKHCAEEYVARTGQGIVWVVAKDAHSSGTLRQIPLTVDRKLAWLQRHDLQCGDLSGMVPLVQGMPMALADHLDRSAKMQFLRGKVKYVHSWILSDAGSSVWGATDRILRQAPMVEFLEFPGADWHLDGCPEAGVYLVSPCWRQWLPDQNWKVLRFGVRRFQLARSPAFAVTAPSAQGCTLPEAIVDLNAGVSTDVMTSYVALHSGASSRGSLGRATVSAARRASRASQG